MMRCNCLAIDDGDITKVVGAMFGNERITITPELLESIYQKLIAKSVREKGVRLHNGGFCPGSARRVKDQIVVTITAHNQQLEPLGEAA